MNPEHPLTAADRETLLATLKARFLANPRRHEGIHWEEVEARIAANPPALASLHAMEHTGGEPDVVGRDPQTGGFQFFDCAPETPKRRTSVCYDPEALQSRKEHKPKDSATGMAAAMGIEVLDEAQYRALQAVGEFDRKTSSWVLTPPAIRALGGALFGDRRYGQVFIYHNGAESYFGARGFRGMLRV